MAKLAKYQVEALVTEIALKLEKKAEEKRNTEETKERLREIENNVSHLKSKYQELRVQRNEINNKINAFRDKLRTIYNLDYVYNTIYDEDWDKILKGAFDKEFPLDVPSKSEIERAIILSDLSGSEDIIETVIKRLGYE